MSVMCVFLPFIPYAVSQRRQDGSHRIPLFDRPVFLNTQLQQSGGSLSNPKSYDSGNNESMLSLYGSWNCSGTRIKSFRAAIAVLTH